MISIHSLKDQATNNCHASKMTKNLSKQSISIMCLYVLHWSMFIRDLKLLNWKNHRTLQCLSVLFENMQSVWLSMDGLKWWKDIKISSLVLRRWLKVLWFGTTWVNRWSTPLTFFYRKKSLINPLRVNLYHILCLNDNRASQTLKLLKTIVKLTIENYKLE